MLLPSFIKSNGQLTNSSQRTEHFRWTTAAGLYLLLCKSSPMILLKHIILPNIFCLSRVQLHLAIKLSLFQFIASSLNLKAISFYLTQDLPKCYQNGNQSRLKEIFKEFLRTERISFYFLHLDFFFFNASLYFSQKYLT